MEKSGASISGSCSDSTLIERRCRALTIVLESLMTIRPLRGLLICLSIAHVLLGFSSARAEEKPMVPVKDGSTMVAGRQLSGNLRVDLFGFGQLSPSAPSMQQASTPAFSKKSPWLAAGMSLLIPGSGEFYAQSYWKAAVFFAIEIAAWALAYTYDKKGDEQTDYFQDFANGHWYVDRYAQWTLDNATTINPNMSAAELAPYTDKNTGVIVNGVVNWGKLNQLESELGNWYSHNLPAYGEQQYYELIGKYEQFYQGWDDANYNLPGYYSVAKANLSPEFLWYSGERGKANDYYTKASTFIAVAIVNHVISAIDAAWTAGSYNKVHAEVGLQIVPTGVSYVQVPVVKVRYGF
jgi:hypothetical protein